MPKDTKRLILGMLVAFGVLIGWKAFQKWQWPEWYAAQDAPPKVEPATAPPTSQSTTGPAATTTKVIGAGPAPATPGASAEDRSKWHARGAAPGAVATTRPTVIGSVAAKDSNFSLGIRTVARGAAIDEVVLNPFDKSAEHREQRFAFQEPFGSDKGAPREDSRALLSRLIVIDGFHVPLGNVDWKLESSDAGSAVYSVDIYNGDKYVARVVKTFKLTPKKDPSEGYIVNVTQRVENKTADPIKYWTIVNGTLTPPREMERQPDQSIIAGYWVENGTTKIFQHLVQSEFGPGFTGKDWTKDEKGRGVLWIGQQSSYFNALVRPVPADGAARNADWLAQAGGDLLNPTDQADHFAVLLNLRTTDQTIAKEAAQDLTYEVYFGPKARKVLGNDFYSAAPRFYDQTLIITSGMCAICTWDWLIRGLVGLLGIFHMVTRDWGVAIILLVLLVRALLHPITKKSQVHMMKMQKMGPELEKLKKKFADDKEALAKAQMSFYKEQGMGPILGCLPMFLQMPIWIALWNALQSTFELRAEPFLYGLTWIKDLAQPDHLIKFAQPISLYFFSMNSINLLPFLLAVVFFLQSKLQPKPPTMTPEQAQQQKMMVWMSTLLFPFFLYTGPSGLNLYILTSTAFGIMESKVIRKHIKEREAAEALRGPIIVDGPDDEAGGAGARRGGGPKGPGGKDAPKKKGWLARLQEKAEELQKQQQQQKKRK